MHSLVPISTLWNWCQMIIYHVIQRIQGNIWGMNWQLINWSMRKYSRTVFWVLTRYQKSTIRCQTPWETNCDKNSSQGVYEKIFFHHGWSIKKEDLCRQIRSKGKSGDQSTTLLPAKIKKWKGIIITDGKPDEFLVLFGNTKAYPYIIHSINIEILTKRWNTKSPK